MTPKIKSVVCMLVFFLSISMGLAQEHPINPVDMTDGERVAHLIQMAQDISREDPDRGLVLVHDALHVAQTSQDDLGVVRALDAMGRIHDAMSNYEDAVKAYLQAIEIAEAHDFTKERALLYSHLGIVYVILGDRNKGLVLCETAVDLAESLADQELLAGVLGHLGLVHVMGKTYDRALVYMQRTLKINEAMNNPRGIAGALSNLGIIYRNQGQYEKALKVQQRALQIRENTGEKRAIASSYSNLGLVYANLGVYDQALWHHQKALALRREVEDKRGASSSLLYIKDVFKAQGDFGQALAYYDRYIALKDSVFNEAQDQKIARLEMQFSTAQTERENTYLRQTNRIQTIVFLLVVILIVVVAVFLYVRYKRRLEYVQMREAHQEALQMRSRIEGIHEMIVTYNHQMNQPLTVIMGMSQIMMQKGFDNEASRKDLEAIYEACVRVKDIMVKISDLKHAHHIKKTEYVDGVQMVDLD